MVGWLVGWLVGVWLVVSSPASTNQSQFINDVINQSVVASNARGR
jgi:ABC-type methionine transport system permease subunit